MRLKERILELQHHVESLRQEAWQRFLRYGDTVTAKSDVKEMKVWLEKGDFFWEELIRFQMCHALAVASSSDKPWWEYFQVDDDEEDDIPWVLALPNETTAEQLLEATQAEVVKYTLRQGFVGRNQQRDPYLYRLLRFQSNVFLKMAERNKESEDEAFINKLKMLAIICLAKAVHKTLYISIEHKMALFESLRGLLDQVGITSYDQQIVEQVHIGQEMQSKVDQRKSTLN